MTPITLEAEPAPKTDNDIVTAARPFAKEIRSKSWWHFATTFSALVGTLVLAAIVPWWPLQIALGILGGLIMVRAFIIYHDVMHNAILKQSLFAKGVMYVYGMIVLSAPNSWRRSHNFHHAHVGKMSCTSVGSFPIMSVKMWQEASPLQRFVYRASRHPITLCAAYLSVFIYSNTLDPLIRRPLKNWDSALALLLHGGIIAALWLLGGPMMALCVFVIPFVLASVLGAYLFYAQHNYKRARVFSSEEWNYNRAALESSSYMKTNPVMAWFTGNIGLHHIHHLNLAIPFYRLPEAMNAVPELQRPADTSLSPKAIYDCLSVKLWDEESERMVSFREANEILAGRSVQ